MNKIPDEPNIMEMDLKPQVYFAYDDHDYLVAAYGGRWYKSAMNDVGGWFTLMTNTYDPAPSDIAAILNEAWDEAWNKSEDTPATVLFIHRGAPEEG